MKLATHTAARRRRAAATASTVIALVVFLGLALLPAVRAAAEGEPLSRTDYVLWTTCTITLYDHQSAPALDRCFQRLAEIAARMGTGVSGSQLDAVSNAAGREPVKVTDDLLFLVQEALTVARQSNGLFDLTVGPLIETWRMNKDDPDVPPRDTIAAALKLVNWRDVVVDPQAKTVFLRRPSMRLDLGGFMKGYAADEMVRILRGYGVRSAMIDLGGNIFAMGSSPRNAPWRIGIQNPEADRGTSIGVVEVTDKSVTTAGVYEHYFVKNGRRYSHIIDLRTGYPVDNSLLSVSVIAPTSTQADAYDTALLVMGVGDGLKLAEQLGLEVIMIDSRHRIYVTPGMKQAFSLTDSSFTFAN